jgi:hypothetical protein
MLHGVQRKDLNQILVIVVRSMFYLLIDVLSYWEMPQCKNISYKKTLNVLTDDTIFLVHTPFHIEIALTFFGRCTRSYDCGLTG